MSTLDDVREAKATLDADRAKDLKARWDAIDARFYQRVAAGTDADVSRSCRWQNLARIEFHLTDGKGPAEWRDWNLACLHAQALGTGPHTSEKETLPYTTSLDAARRFVRDVLPGFWVSSGLCDLTGHASLGPDYNGPDRERLQREWPDDDPQYRNGWDEDLAPGGEQHRECRAILACAVRALMYRNERS